MSSVSREERLDRVAEALKRFAATAQLEDQVRGKAVGLTLQSVDATVLGLLRIHGPLTPRQLAVKAGIGSSGTITGAIDRLERSGWTCRTPCQVDRRKVFIALTDAAVDGPLTPAMKAHLEGCSDAQLDAISEVLAIADVQASPEVDR